MGMEVKQSLNEAITQQVNEQLGSLHTQSNAATVDAQLDSLTKDTEEAQSAVQEMKAEVHLPSVDHAAAKAEGKAEAQEDAHADITLGSSEADADEAKKKAAASTEVMRELAAASAK